MAQIGTFSTLSTKAAFKDVGRVLGIDHNLINEMNKLIPVVNGEVASIDEALEDVPELREWEERYPRLFELGRQVSNLPRSASIHACGILITSDEIEKSVPLSKGGDGERVTQYDGPTLEKLGFLKFDFLGLKNLSVIEIARRLVEKRHGILINVDELEPEDEKVFETIQRGNTQGIFQLESEGMQKLFQGLNKVDFESMIAGVSLYRPGPMAHIPDYQARANGYTPVTYFHPDAEKVMEDTFGIMIYQEQLMQLAGEFGGYTAGEQDGLRKATGKKSQEVMDKVLPELKTRILEKNYTETVANQIVKLIEPFVGYGFNRSHAAAYAYVAYQCAYFKTYYPAEFFAGLLTVFADKKDRVTRYIADAKEMGIDLLPPDLNVSEEGFSIEEDSLRFGLGSIDGLGVKITPILVENRPYTSLEDLITRIPKRNLNKKVVETLALSGTLDNLGKKESLMDRKAILAHLYQLRKDKIDLDEEMGEFTLQKKLTFEQKYLGMYVSGHPLDEVGKPVNWEKASPGEKFDAVGVITSFKQLKTRKGDDMAFVNIETHNTNERVVLFPDIFETIKVPLQKGLIVKMELLKKYDAYKDEMSYIAKKFNIPKRINKDILG